ncbi:MAG: sodium:calcium antiporter [Azospirillaceae bacterium]
MLLDLTALPTALIAAVFLAAAIAIGFAGTKLTGVAERLASLTGLGQATMGAVFLGATTSLSGSITTGWAAGFGETDLAISNAVGGIAVQTAYLAVADIVYRKANLEHAAASLENLAYGALLIALLAFVLCVMSAPEVTVLGIHPASLILVVGYVSGLRIVSHAGAERMWQPRQTADTQTEERFETDPVAKRATPRLWLVFAGLALVTAACGFVVAETGVSLSERTGLSRTAVGALFTASVTSLPELVTAIAAVHRGALRLAVSDIIGGNSFDVLFLIVADVIWLDGSIYHAFTNLHVYVVAVSMLMTGILLLGLLRRERLGFGGIGFESALILALYAVSVVVLIGV